jgi:hypothetical protein
MNKKKEDKSTLVKVGAFIVGLCVFTVVWKISEVIQAYFVGTSVNYMSEVATRNLEASLIFLSVIISVYLGKKTYDKIVPKTE